MSAHFHVNYLPDLMETFAQLIPARGELVIEDALVQGPVREATLLDAKIAQENVQIQLADTAWVTAFRTNHLYGQETANVSPAQLAAFHSAVLGRKDGFSLLLGVNESSIISSEQLRGVMNSAGLTEASNPNATSQVQATNYFGSEIRIEEASRGANHALLAFALPNSGIANINFPANWLMQSCLQTQKASGDVYSSVSADASLHGVFFESVGAELNDHLSGFLSSLKKFKLDEEAFKALKSRAIQNYAHSLDSRGSKLLIFANQIALRGTFLSEAEMKKAIEVISAEQFSHLLTEATKNPTLVSKGALKELPYLSQL